MLLGVLSDTHDNRERTRTAVSILQSKSVDALVHCGDITTPEIVRQCCEIPLYFCFGNHDSDTAAELRCAAEDVGAECLGWGGEILLGNKRIGVTHGHMSVDVRPLLEGKPDYLLTGHFHQHADWSDDGVRRICPGALHRADVFTVALVNLACDEVSFLAVD